MTLIVKDILHSSNLNMRFFLKAKKERNKNIDEYNIDYYNKKTY